MQVGITTVPQCNISNTSSAAINDECRALATGLSPGLMGDPGPPDGTPKKQMSPLGSPGGPRGGPKDLKSRQVSGDWKSCNRMPKQL